MSEKRFIMEGGVLKYGETGEPVRLYDVVDLLNEQQEDLNYLAKFIGEFKVEEFKDKLRNLRLLEDKIGKQQATIERLERKLELKTEEVEYLKRMMVKWGMVKDE